MDSASAYRDRGQWFMPTHQQVSRILTEKGSVMKGVNATPPSPSRHPWDRQWDSTGRNAIDLVRKGGGGGQLCPIHLLHVWRRRRQVRVSSPARVERPAIVVWRSACSGDVLRPEAWVGRCRYQNHPSTPDAPMQSSRGDDATQISPSQNTSRDRRIRDNQCAGGGGLTGGGVEIFRWLSASWCREPTRAKRGEYAAAPECRGGGKRDVPEKTHRPVASSGTIPTSENPGRVPSGIEAWLALMGSEWPEPLTDVAPCITEFGIIATLLIWVMLGPFVFTTLGPVMGRVWLVSVATSGPAMVPGASQLLANCLPAWHPTVITWCDAFVFHIPPKGEVDRCRIFLLCTLWDSGVRNPLYKRLACSPPIPDSIPGRVTLGYSQVGIVIAGQQVFPGNSRFPSLHSFRPRSILSSFQPYELSRPLFISQKCLIFPCTQVEKRVANRDEQQFVIAEDVSGGLLDPDCQFLYLVLSSDIIFLARKHAAMNSQRFGYPTKLRETRNEMTPGAPRNRTSIHIGDGAECPVNFTSGQPYLSPPNTPTTHPYPAPLRSGPTPRCQLSPTTPPLQGPGGQSPVCPRFSIVATDLRWHSSAYFHANQVPFACSHSLPSLPLHHSELARVQRYVTLSKHPCTPSSSDLLRLHNANHRLPSKTCPEGSDSYHPHSQRRLFLKTSAIDQAWSSQKPVYTSQLQPWECFFVFSGSWHPCSTCFKKTHPTRYSIEIWWFLCFNLPALPPRALALRHENFLCEKWRFLQDQSDGFSREAAVDFEPTWTISPLLCQLVCGERAKLRSRPHCRTACAVRGKRVEKCSAGPCASRPEHPHAPPYGRSSLTCPTTNPLPRPSALQRSLYAQRLVLASAHAQQWEEELPPFLHHTQKLHFMMHITLPAKTCNPTLLHTHLVSPSSALKTPVLRTTKISSIAPIGQTKDDFFPLLETGVDKLREGREFTRKLAEAQEAEFTDAK
ncbi:hypothetical protein PR048_025025 [Dryococelus australis]|uniref:Uncharacterized protein n=1 Tax=Dryococelus australis TaxID=614101 RepID=A0ABQ9GQ90_9NEOP|nr:hypothetical protein PR048_025025 [Dryococelus australis]